MKLINEKVQSLIVILFVVSMAVIPAYYYNNKSSTTEYKYPEGATNKIKTSDNSFHFTYRCVRIYFLKLGGGFSIVKMEDLEGCKDMSKKAEFEHCKSMDHCVSIHEKTKLKTKIKEQEELIIYQGRQIKFLLDIIKDFVEQNKPLNPENIPYLLKQNLSLYYKNFKPGDHA